MDIKYIIVYTFKSLLETGEEEYGHGEIHITTDHRIETQDDLKEVARSIAQKNSGFVEVAINKVTEVSDD